MSDGIFRVHVRPEGEGVRVVLSGELDLAGIDELEQVFAEACEPGRPLTIDLTGLEFIDSSGLRVLLGVHNAAARQGFAYTVIAGPPQVHRAFALCGLDRTLAFAA
jgi:anti-anti-sigma factor